MIKQRLDRAEMCRKCPKIDFDAYENTDHALGQIFLYESFRENWKFFRR
jgi:hypothetical protein